MNYEPEKHYDWTSTFERYNDWYKWVKDSFDADRADEIMIDENATDYQAKKMFPDIPKRSQLWTMQEDWSINADIRVWAAELSEELSE